MLNPNMNLNAELLKAVEFFYSDQTNLLHLSYHERPFVKNDPIPLYHNFLYALILLKSKEKEKMQRGIEIVDHLLYFQVQTDEEKGAFPRYLHEYPKIERSFEKVDVLLPLFHIYGEFKGIFPSKIKMRLKKAILNSLHDLSKLIENNDLSYLLSLQMASLLYGFGDQFKVTLWKDQGLKKIEHLFSMGLNKALGSTRHLSKMMLYLSILPIEKMPCLESFYTYLDHVWHPDLRAYIGVGLNEHFYQSSFEPTLFHFLMDPSESYRSMLFKADFLELVLVCKAFGQKSTSYRSSSYSMYPFEVSCGRDQGYAYSFFNLPKEKWEKRGGFYPFKLLFLDGEKKLSSLMLHMGGYVQIKKINSYLFHLTFENNKESDLDVSFYLPFSSRVKISSENQKSTMFDFASPLEIDYGSFKVEVSLKSFATGVWAQLCKGNRRSQLINEFNQTFDWNIYLRRAFCKDFDPIELEIRVEPY